MSLGLVPTEMVSLTLRPAADDARASAARAAVARAMAVGAGRITLRA